MEKIIDFHGLEGEISRDPELEEWLERRVREVVIEGKRFALPDFEYRNRRVYEEIMDIPRGSKEETFGDRRIEMLFGYLK